MNLEIVYCYVRRVVVVLEFVLEYIRFFMDPYLISWVLLSPS